jgi:regulatory protein
MESLGFDEIKLRLERFCAYQERCTKDVLNKIQSLGTSDKSMENSLLDVLKKNNFLNDKRFVSSYVEGRVNIKKWGVNKIRSGLFQRHIPQQLIEEGLRDLNREVYKKNLISLVAKKNATLPEKETAFIKKTKVLRCLASKGYTAEDCEGFF